MSRRGHRSILIVPIVGCLLLMIMGIFVHNAMLIALAAAAQMITLLPLLALRETDYFSTWTFVIFSVFIGLLVRSIYITLDIPSAEAIRRVFLLDSSKDSLLLPALLMLLGVILLTVGYVSGSSEPRSIPSRLFDQPIWNEKRYVITVLILLTISMWATFTFVNDQGGWAITNISRKRNVFRDISTYSAQGYLRWAMASANIAMSLIFARYLSTKRSPILHLALFIPALALASFAPFFTSNRGELIANLIVLVAVYYYLHTGRFRWRYLTAFFLAGIVIFNLMTVLRGDRYLEISALPSLSELGSLFEPVVISRNLLDTTKLAHILYAIPEKLEFELGRTMLSWTYAWIPRSLWPSKPIIGAGQLVAAAIYRSPSAQAAGGIPPGLFAELYWNFWFPGVIIGGFLLGRFLRFVDLIIITNSDNLNVVLLYVSSFMLIGMQLLGGSFSQSMINFLTSFVPIYLILLFINVPSVYHQQAMIEQDSFSSAVNM